MDDDDPTNKAKNSSKRPRRKRKVEKSDSEDEVVMPTVVCSPSPGPTRRSYNTRKARTVVKRAVPVATEASTPTNHETSQSASMVEELLSSKLDDNQKTLLQQLLLIKEKEKQFAVESKDRSFAIEKKRYELTIEQKNAEIATKQHELDLVKLQQAATKDTSIEEKIDSVEKQLLEKHAEVITDSMGDMANTISEIIGKRVKTKIQAEMELLKWSMKTNSVTFRNDSMYSYKTYVPLSWLSPMVFGVHKWTVKCCILGEKRESIDICLGLTTASDHLKHEKKYEKISDYAIGFEIPGWGYSMQGFIGAPKAVKGPRRSIQHGDIITFTLDLRAKNEDKNDTDDDGTLYICINNGEKELMGSGLSDIAKSKGGFFPAVTLFMTAAVFYDYEHSLDG